MLESDDWTPPVQIWQQDSIFLLLALTLVKINYARNHWIFFFFRVLVMGFKTCFNNFLFYHSQFGGVFFFRDKTYRVPLWSDVYCLLFGIIKHVSFPLWNEKIYLVSSLAWKGVSHFLFEVTRHFFFLLCSDKTCLVSSLEWQDCFVYSLEWQDVSHLRHGGTRCVSFPFWSDKTCLISSLENTLP